MISNLLLTYCGEVMLVMKRTVTRGRHCTEISCLEPSSTNQ